VVFTLTEYLRQLDIFCLPRGTTICLRKQIGALRRRRKGELISKKGLREKQCEDIFLFGEMPKEEIMFKSPFRSVTIAVCASAFLVLMTFTSLYAQTVVLNSTVIPASGGIWIVAPTGKVSFCVVLYNGSSGSPLGQCGAIGTITANNIGFHYSVFGSSLYIINKASGAISLCTMLVPSFSYVPKGGCIQNSSLAVLQ
jgi:hypothetical protein